MHRVASVLLQVSGIRWGSWNDTYAPLIMGTTVFIFQQKKKKVSFETYIERKKKQFSQITLTSHFGIMTLENNFHLSSPFPF